MLIALFSVSGLFLKYFCKQITVDHFVSKIHQFFDKKGTTSNLIKLK